LQQFVSRFADWQRNERLHFLHFFNGKTSLLPVWAQTTAGSLPETGALEKSAVLASG
jgi:hypothetical protein